MMARPQMMMHGRRMRQMLGPPAQMSQIEERMSTLETLVQQMDKRLDSLQSEVSGKGAKEAE
jgi:hypothetical protein